MLPNRCHRWIVAHRGVSDRCPESTRAAFAAAIADGADAIECDLQLTADNNIVVCHDTTFERYGHPHVRVSETTLSHLQTLDMGSWFAPEFRDERLLSLDELLDDFGHRIPLCLEVKTEELTPAQTGVLLRQLADVIVSHRLQKQVVILCFDTESLRQVRELAAWATLILNSHTPDQIDAADLQQMPWLNGVDGNIVCLDERLVRTLHQMDLISLCFTCNCADDVLNAWDLGVDGLITNDPGRTREILRQHGRHSHAS